MKDKKLVRRHFLSLVTILLLALSQAGVGIAPAAGQRQQAQQATAGQLRDIRQYIKQGWHTLTRSNAQLAKAAVDPKFHAPPGYRWPIYLSGRESLPRVEERLRSELKPEDFARIELRALPTDTSRISEHGLLYLPYPYVVPGGRFNEMYGWDSYFIQVGLVRDGETVLARNMVDNFIYEIENYGRVLNANRTYYLSRSQPPFLTQMILNVYRKSRDRQWLRSTLPAIEKYYRFWTSEPHLTTETGLSRYYDLGDGPAPEVLSDEKDEQGRTHYDRVKEYYRTHEVADYDVGQYYDKARDELTPLFYKGDRSMRESGFDPSNRFGPFNIDIIHYDPVCLNSLLYLMERDAAEIMREVGRGRVARQWLERAEARRRAVNRLMWDERDGLYYDYNFQKKAVRRYPFATSFYPLWVGIADRRQAARIVSNLHLFERAGGLQTSTNQSGNQWDAPFGWAPLQMIGVWGLRRYGYHREADRITANFLSTILKEFIQYKTIVEKYDVERRESEISSGIKFGYTYNVIGFGWTNAAFTDLYALLPLRERPTVQRLDGVPVP
jgi:alpha,alpha-trehalase